MTTARRDGAHRFIEDADIELNGVTFEWGPQGKHDELLVSVLVHEVGHVLGFEDLCTGAGRAHAPARPESCPEDRRRSVMVPGSIKTELAPYDEARLCQLYPKASAPAAAPAPGSESSGCSLGGTASTAVGTTLSALLPLGVIAFGWRRRLHLAQAAHAAALARAAPRPNRAALR